MNKVLVSIFAILLIIMSGEAIYYFIKFPNKPSLTSTVPLTNSMNPTPTPPYYKKDGAVTEAILTTTADGNIIDLNLNGGVLQPYNFKYKLKISFKKNNDIRTRYFTEEEVNRCRIPITKLKLGNHITIKSSNDLSKGLIDNLIDCEVAII